tara:strand:- start:1163 stop:2416 length:1254 start_codon:yes stop_codon:yes gene_type:complete
MIKNFIKDYTQIERKDKLFFLVIVFFPISLILGNLITNIFIFLFSISFFLNLKQNIFFLKNKITYIFLFFFIALLINVLFSLYPINSLPRVIKFFFIILFVIETLRIFNKYEPNIIKNIFLIWSSIFVIILLDCIFEIIFGVNTIGNSTVLTGRIASFFGDELVVGAFVHGFALFFIGYLINQNSNNYILAFCILTIVMISFLIGERSNFIKLFFSITLISMIGIKANYYYKILTLLIITFLTFIIINFNKDYKYRYYNQIQSLYQKDGFINYYKNSQYGAHHSTAIKIFYEFPLFGVGIKNFRHESIKEKYNSSNYKSSNARQATHPHQIHLEFLSETGIFGYLCFLIFILFSLKISLKNYFKNRNIFQLSSIIFVLSSLLPFLPSGSFLSTFNSGIFWVNFAIMLGFCKISKKNL